MMLKRKIKEFTTSCFCGLLMISLSQAAHGQQAGGIQHVIVIGIDGMSSEGLRLAHTPTVDRMIAWGSAAWTMRSVLPSDSSPNWASMIMGSGPEQHGVTNNDWEPDNHTLAPVVVEKGGRYPSIFSIVRKHCPSCEIGSVYHWGGFGRLYDKAAVNFDQRHKTPDAAASAFASYIAEKKPTLAFLQLDHVDGAGHKHGFTSTPYHDAISKSDSLIAEILQSIDGAGIADQTLVMVVSDHGGIDKGHGGATPEEMTIPIVFSGTDVKKGSVITEPTYIYDIAATIAYALRVKTPDAWIGRPIKNVFKGRKEGGD